VKEHLESFNTSDDRTRARLGEWAVWLRKQGGLVALTVWLLTVCVGAALALAAYAATTTIVTAITLAALVSIVFFNCGFQPCPRD